VEATGTTAAARPPSPVRGVRLALATIAALAATGAVGAGRVAVRTTARVVGGPVQPPVTP
jgi:hypothetical protein